MYFSSNAPDASLKLPQDSNRKPKYLTSYTVKLYGATIITKIRNFLVIHCRLCGVKPHYEGTLIKLAGKSAVVLEGHHERQIVRLSEPPIGSGDRALVPGRRTLECIQQKRADG